MKESNSEDLASRAGPESSEGALEALTGETTGRVIEPRNCFILREADLLMARGRQHRASRIGKASTAPARSETLCMWGRPRTQEEIMQLVVRMAKENERWGYTRIRDAINNLGHDVSRGTVANILILLCYFLKSVEDLRK